MKSGNISQSVNLHLDQKLKIPIEKQNPQIHN